MVADAPDTALNALLRVLDLEQLEDNLFRGARGNEGWQRVYGGQVLGQALMAAVAHRRSRRGWCTRCTATSCSPAILPTRSSTTWSASATAAASRPGASRRSSTARAIFTMSASFHKAEEGFDHQSADARRAADRRRCPTPRMPSPASSTSCPPPCAATGSATGRSTMRIVDISRYLTREKKAPAPAHLDPRHGPPARRPGHPPGRAGLRLRLHPARHGAYRARQAPVRRRRPAREPRPRHLVPPHRSAPTTGCSTSRTAPAPTARAASAAGSIYTRDGRLDRLGGPGGAHAFAPHKICA